MYVYTNVYMYIRISTRIECLSGLTGFVVSEENKTETRTVV